MENNINNRVKKVIDSQRKSYFVFKAPNYWYLDELAINKKRFALILKNQKQPTLDELERIANALNVKIEELIDYKTSENSSN